MSARHAVATVLAGVGAAALAAGCAVTVAGSPQAASSPPTRTGAAAPRSADPGAAPATTSRPVSTGRGIRPMPPLVPSGTSTAGSPDNAIPTAPGPSDASIAGIGIAAVLADLNAGHVAVVDSAADPRTLASLVDGARAQGLDLSVVTIGRDIDDADTSRLADALFTRIGGTLLVLSPSLVSARSEQLTDEQRDAAVGAAADGTDDEQATSAFVDSVLRTAPALSAKTPATAGETVVGGIDVAALVHALGPDHISVGAGITELTAGELAAPVRRAWGAGLSLYVAILDQNPTGHLYDVAAAVMRQTGGTVIVVSPSMYALASTVATDAQLAAALSAGAGSTGYPSLVENMVEALVG